MIFLVRYAVCGHHEAQTNLETEAQNLRRHPLVFAALFFSVGFGPFRMKQMLASGDGSVVIPEVASTCICDKPCPSCMPCYLTPLHLWVTPNLPSRLPCFTCHRCRVELRVALGV